MKVSNMTSSRGNKVANQFVLTGCPAGTITLPVNPAPFSGEYERIGSGDMFQSYDSNIAYRDYMGNLYLDEYYWDYSATTSRYRNQFTGLNTAQTKAGIKDGSIKLVNLN